MKNIHILPTDKLSRLYKFADKLYLDTTQKDYYRKYNIYITSNEETKEGQNYIEDGFLGKNKFKWHKRQVEKYPNIKKDIIILTDDTDVIKDGVQAIPDEFLEWFVKNPSCVFIKTRVTNELFKSVLDEVSFYEIIIPKEESYTKVQQKSLQLNKKFAETVDLEKIMSDFDETKQETLEEAGLKHCDILDKFPALVNPLFSFKEGSKWQREQDFKEVQDLKSRLDVVNEKSSKVIKMIEDLQKRSYSERDIREAIQETITLIRNNATEFRNHENTIMEKLKRNSK